MTRMTCREAADEIVRRHGFENLTAENFLEDAPIVFRYVVEEVDEAAFAFAKQLSDEDKFGVWYTCDDAMRWQDGLDMFVNDTKSKMLEGLSGHALYMTIKAMFVSLASST